MKRKLSMSALLHASSDVLNTVFKDASKVTGRPKIFATLGVMPLGATSPQFALIGADNLLAISIYVFEDYETLARYRRMVANPAESEETSLMDFVHSALLLPRVPGARIQISVGKPGYIPRSATRVETLMLEDVVREVYNFLLRVEDAGSLEAWRPDIEDLPQTSNPLIFMRSQNDDGEWRDGLFEICEEPDLSVQPLNIPPAEVAQLQKLKVDKAAEMAVGLVSINVSPSRSRVRPFYLMCVDLNTAKLISLQQLSVPPKAEFTDMTWLWRMMLIQLVRNIKERGVVPGTISVTSHCMQKYLRLLCEYLPFKLVFHESLPVLNKIVTEVFNVDNVIMTRGK